MAVDSEERDDTTQKGYKAGSKALDYLDRLITSTESFFHPSNSGPWTTSVSFASISCKRTLIFGLKLTTFLQRLTFEFTKRVKEEGLESCKTPVVGVSSCVH